MFVISTQGVKTPEEVYNSLKKYGHLIAVHPDPFLNGTRKYYTIKHFDDDRIVEVLIIGEQVIYTQFVPASAEKTLVRNTDIPKKNTEIIFGEI